MTAENDRNKAMVRAFIEAIDRKDLDTALTMVTDEGRGQGELPRGRRGIPRRDAGPQDRHP
jgi:hypothetical protein